MHFYRPKKLSQEPKKKASRQNPVKPPVIASGWKLDYDSDLDVKSQQRNPQGPLTSVLTRRVPDGKVRRSALLSGDLFIELKVYNVDDIKTIAPLDRWEKALVNLKLQVDSDSHEIKEITKLLKKCKERFVGDAVFYAEKRK